MGAEEGPGAYGAPGVLLRLLRFFHGLNHMSLGVLASLFDCGETTVARVTADFLAAR